MRRRGLWVACVVLLIGVGVLAVGTGFAKDEGDKDEDDGAKCSEATLHGQYLLAYDGVDITGNAQVPFAAAGYDVFDGNGKTDAVFSSNFNGQITRKEHFSGTYTVKADCTGTSTYSDGSQYDLFIAPDGDMFTFVQINPPESVASGFELRGTAERVGQFAKDENAKDEDDEKKCSEATLDGRYLAAHNGVVTEETKKGPPQGPFAQAGYEMYDGNGNVDGLFSLNFNGNVFRHVPVPGTYTVKANCTGTSTFISEEGVPFRADLFIDPDGSMYTFVQTNPPEVVASGFELRGTAKRVGD